MKIAPLFISKHSWLSLVLTIAATFSAQADVTVCASGCDYTSIQAGINAVQNNQTVKVKAGTYYEAVTIDKAITLKGVNGRDKTFINASQSNSPVLIIGQDTTLTGFTIEGGSGINGGGIVVNSGNANINDNIIKNNTASEAGAGIWINIEATASLINNKINNNTAGTIGGGVAYGEYAKLVIDNNEFNNNQAIRGGGVYVTSYTTTTLRGNTFNNNKAAFGGGVYFDQYVAKHNNWDPVKTLVFERNQLLRNTATQNGGGIYSDSYSFAAIVNSLIHNNTAARGGGLYSRRYSYVNVVNSTIADNTADAVGGIKVDAYSNLQVINSILWNNSGKQINRTDYGRAEVSYSDVQNGYSGTGNMNAAPLFVNPLQNNYNVKSSSPVIDTGRDTAPDFSLVEDYANNKRPQDGDGLGNGSTGDGSDYDMGAFEFIPSINLFACDFKVKGDNTISDPRTGLMWIQDAQSIGSRAWQTAQSNVNNLTIAGYSDWRLPEIDELATLYGTLTSRGAYDPSPFVNMEINGSSDWRWSNTLIDNNCSSGWRCQAKYFDFEKGVTNDSPLYRWLWMLPVRNANEPLCQ
ncbi:MAG: DUF1566 domain-containing protein [Gammaproteobacteria bacterium]|nr:DUF1566 domain-containing protein [Gammaproteobacteria bacterium]